MFSYRGDISIVIKTLSVLLRRLAKPLFSQIVCADWKIKTKLQNATVHFVKRANSSSAVRNRIIYFKVFRAYVFFRPRYYFITRTPTFSKYYNTFRLNAFETVVFRLYGNNGSYFERVHENEKINAAILS